MNLAHITWLLSRNGGGIPPVVRAIGRAQRGLGHEARIFGVRDPREPDNLDGADQFRALGPLALGFALGMEPALEALGPELLHLHGLFTWPSRVACSFGRRNRRPVVISPHGMLDEWALANSAWKKRLFRYLIEDENLRRAACLQALCVPEAEQFRRLGLRNTVAVIPNGVDIPATIASPAAFLEHHPAAHGRPLLLFLGRIHPKKGLSSLLEAWAAVKRDRPRARDWLVVVAGPDQVGHAGEIVRMANDRGLARDVLLTGPLYGDLKESAFGAASGFVLPSLSEGFPVAVLEAMARRVPVLVTRRCNIDVEAFGGGLVAEPEPESLSSKLRELIDRTDAERKAMGACARREVELRYNWERVAGQLVETYGWILGRNGRPSFIETAA